MTLRRLLLAAVLATLLPTVAAAQRCGVSRAWLGAAGGLAHYDTGGGTDATEAGADLAVRLGPVAVQAGYRRVLPEHGEADPDVFSVAVGVPVTRLSGFGVCAVAHGGGSRFAAGEDDGSVVAGGLGLRLERPLADGRVVPFLEVRGLAASLSGAVLDVDLDSSGLALGGEGGLSAAVGPVHVRATAGVNGFAGGLGVTPYPARVFRLGLGFGF